jgi:hypothetical protein
MTLPITDRIIGIISLVVMFGSILLTIIVLIKLWIGE